MGVPGLDRFVRIKHPKCVNCDVKKGEVKCDYLCIDGNPFIHKAAQLVFNYGQSKRLLNNFASLSYEQKIQSLFKKCFEYITTIIEFVEINDGGIVYVSIDGVAPVSKQIQQRQRRFIKNEIEFDSNCISAGTRFMQQICKYLYKNLKEYCIMKKNKIIFSPHTVPGEGEHKIMDFIRLEPYKKVCMFGPDGDLIMLGLSLENPFILLKEDMYNYDKFYTIDITKLRSDLTIFPPLNFVFMGMLLGNDFLPKLEMFFSIDIGIKIFNSIKKCNHVINDKTIDVKVFKDVLNLVQRFEKDNLEKEAKTADGKFYNKTLNDCIDLNETLNFKKYKNKYYKEKCNITTKEEIKNLVFDFLDGMVWVFEYYTKGCPSFSWYYKHYYPPFVDDICYFIDEWKIPSFKKDTPHLPFQQLMAILPPHSFDLLPSPFMNTLPIEESKTQIHIDYEGKTKEYQGIVVITPKIDFNDILEKYEKVSKILKYEYARNKVSKDIYFK